MKSRIFTVASSLSISSPSLPFTNTNLPFSRLRPLFTASFESLSEFILMKFERIPLSTERARLNVFFFPEEAAFSLTAFSSGFPVFVYFTILFERFFETETPRSFPETSRVLSPAFKVIFFFCFVSRFVVITLSISCSVMPETSVFSTYMPFGACSFAHTFSLGSITNAAREKARAPTLSKTFFVVFIISTS